MTESIDIASELAMNFEGLSLEPYLCPGFMPTIGYGHLLSRTAHGDLTQYESITHEEAKELLKHDMMSAARSVDRLITAPLTTNQRAALYDFAFNCGSGNLQASTLRRVINRGEYCAAPEQFARWVYAGKRRLRGLIRRRSAEIKIFMA